MAGNVTLQQVMPRGRVSRRPAHHFQLRQSAFAIQPAFIAPVLPGETMKNLLLQARAVLDPVKNPMLGWWLEYYVFYVKLRDLAERDAFVQMIMTPDQDMSAQESAPATATYHAGGINWTQHCLQRVVEEYFRDEGEVWNHRMIAGLPMASVNTQTWLDSVKADSASPVQDHELPGENPSLPSHMAGWENHYAQWESMRALRLTEATFEDWLKTFGVSAPKPETETHRPELVRYVRDWTYPAATVDHAGAPASSPAWSISERADKDRFFKEPGFVFGVSVVRPKVYMRNQVGSAVSMLNNAFSFLPAVLSDEPYTSLRQFQTGATPDGPLGANPTEPYWVDLRDLFLYGDQFVNFSLASTDAGLVALPSNAMEKRFATQAEIAALFATVGKELLRQEGVASLNIAGRLVDTT